MYIIESSEKALMLLSPDVIQMGVVLRVKNSAGGDTREYFFEVKFPPEQWRLLCLQHDGGSKKVNVVKGDSFIKAGQRA